MGALVSLRFFSCDEKVDSVGTLIHPVFIPFVRFHDFANLVFGPWSVLVGICAFRSFDYLREFAAALAPEGVRAAGGGWNVKRDNPGSGGRGYFFVSDD